MFSESLAVVVKEGKQSFSRFVFRLISGDRLSRLVNVRPELFFISVLKISGASKVPADIGELHHWQACKRRRG